VTMADSLPDLPAVQLTDRGLARVLHGNTVGPESLDARALPLPGAGEIRLLDPSGALVAIAHARGGALHPILVVG
jgi:hypothetical protein